MDKVAQSPGAGSGEPLTSDEEGRSGQSRKQSKLVRGMKKLLSGGRKKGSKESELDTASTCSSSSRRGANSPRTPRHGGAYPSSPRHRDSLEPMGKPHKVSDKELKRDRPDLVAHPGPKKHGAKIPDAGATTLAYTVFENDDVKDAKLAECHEKEGKLQKLGETPVKKKREKKESGKSGKSVEPTRKNSKQRGRTKESPGVKTATARTPKSPGKSMEPTRKKSTPKLSVPRAPSRERLSRESTPNASTPRRTPSNERMSRESTPNGSTPRRTPSRERLSQEK